MLAHVRHPIAEPFMGGMEAHSWHLADGLATRGHDVVLFAAGDSDPRFPIDPVLDRHYEATFPWAEHRGSAPLIAHVDAGYAAACDRIASGGFDVVHNNSLHRFPLERRRTSATPTVTSLHVPPFDALSWFVTSSPAPHHRITVTSARQLRAWWPAGAPAEASVLHNGIDLDRWRFQPSGDGSAAWCGRITPNKGTHHAIEAARMAGIGLTLYGSVDDAEYWRDVVRPLLGADIRYAGHLDATELPRALGRASVLLFTPCWDEPFGLVATEAMACGVPVAAFDTGAAREVVGDAGRYAPPADVPALARAIADAVAIPRAHARARAERLFSRDRWLDACERLYHVVAGTPMVAVA